MSDQSITERPAYQQRVIHERNELKYKVDKLDLYLKDPHSSTISKMEWSELVEQQGYMQKYLDILNKRIARFEGQA